MPILARMDGDAVVVKEPGCVPLRINPGDAGYEQFAKVVRRGLVEDTAGYTGVIKDKLGREYHFVNGERIKWKKDQPKPEIREVRIGDTIFRVLSHDPEAGKVKVKDLKSGEVKVVSQSEIGDGESDEVYPGSQAAHADAEKYMDERMEMLDAMVQQAVDDNEEVTGEAGTWDDLDSDTQEEVENKYVESNFHDYYEAEVQSWSENLGEDASEQLREDHEWHDDYFKEWAKDNGFTEESAEEAIDTTFKTLSYEQVKWPESEGVSEDLRKAVLDVVNGKERDRATSAAALGVGHVWKELQGGLFPAIADDNKDSISLVGKALEDIKVAQWHNKVTHGHTYKGMEPDFDKLRFEDGSEIDEEDDWEGEWDHDYKKAKDKRIDEIVDEMSNNPPDYLNEQADEYAHESWSQKDDDEKFKHAEDYGLTEGEGSKTAEMPDDWRVFNDGEDYNRTRSIARLIQSRRAAQLVRDRLDAHEGWGGMKVDTDALSSKVWSAWKGSSTSKLGWALQMASAEELGGFLRMERDDKEKANDAFVKIAMEAQGKKPQGGTEEAIQIGKEVMKAYARATWEASQYVLRKAGIEDLTVWRGLLISKDEVDGEGKATEVKLAKSRSEGRHGDPVSFTKLPGINLRRNGCASTTTKASVANGWGGVGVKPPNATRVVLRIKTPRTAVLSAPCFGQNLVNEEETVLAGTSWHDWDAWLDKAPPEGFEEVPADAKASENEEAKP